MLREETDWQERAACRTYPFPQDFFDMSPNPSAIRARVQSVCDRCPVIAACQDFVDNQERGLPLLRCHGFWAGQTPKERIWRRNRAKRRKHKNKDRL